MDSNNAFTWVIIQKFPSNQHTHLYIISSPYDPSLTRLQVLSLYFFHLFLPPMYITPIHIHCSRLVPPTITFPLIFLSQNLTPQDINFLDLYSAENPTIPNILHSYLSTRETHPSFYNILSTLHTFALLMTSSHSPFSYLLTCNLAIIFFSGLKNSHLIFFLLNVLFFSKPPINAINRFFYSCTHLPWNTLNSKNKLFFLCHTFMENRF